MTAPAHAADLARLAADAVPPESVRAMAAFDARAGELCWEFARDACPGTPDEELSAAVGELRESAPPEAAPVLTLIARILAEDRAPGPARTVDDPMLRMLERCWVALPQFVAGRRTGVDLVFPQGERRLWADLQAHSHHMRPYARVAAETVLRLAPGHARILEIGAGSGAATAEFVARAGGRAPARYLMTDISPTFLRDARLRFTARWLAYEPLDFTRPMTGPKHDLVVGTNAMHCAADVATALRHTWELVAPGGYLVLSEGARPADGRVWRPELIFALLPGWWQVSRGSDRADIGFLRPGEWAALAGRLPHAEAAVLPVGASTQVIGALIVVRRT